MLIAVLCDHINGNVGEVIFLGNTPTGELVLTNTTGCRSRYILVGTDRRSPLVRREVALQQDSTGRGVYYGLDAIPGHSDRR